MADGSNLELPHTFCPAHSPPSQRACAQQACPPGWVLAGWSQVSSALWNSSSPQVVTPPLPQCLDTCGGGVQELQTTCGPQGSEVDPESCFRIPQPTAAQPCFPGACASKTPVAGGGAA